MSRQIVLCLIAALTLANAAPAQSIEIVSALGPQADAEIRGAIVEARSVYAAFGLELRKPNLPTLVVALPTVLDLAPYIGPHAGRSRAFSFAGTDRNYIALAWDAPGNPLRAAAHEYAHLVDPIRDAPAWFREGLAEHLSYFERTAGGGFVAATPARHLARLRGSEWLSLEALRRATRNSEDFQAPAFYAQSWLLVHWLAARGKAPHELLPSDLDEALESIGADNLEALLRAAVDAMAPAQPRAQPAAVPPPAVERPWQARLALAEIDRELGRIARAEAALSDLERERPGNPAVASAWGALAMDAGRYDEAEAFLERGAADPEASARTRYRLALMLLRPSEGLERQRAKEAVLQARLALEQVPAAADYRLALAQALMVAEDWDAAAAELRALAAEPAWRGRAEEEMAELIRRRQQAVSQESRPVLPPSRTASVPVSPLETAEVRPPPKPAPPPPMRWPPSGTAIMAGRIDYVDCSGPEKLIVMRHPVLNLRFREPKGRPAKLFACPMKDWSEIPCGAKGWTVNVAYRPRRAPNGVLGDAVAILF